MEDFKFHIGEDRFYMYYKSATKVPSKPSGGDTQRSKSENTNRSNPDKKPQQKENQNNVYRTTKETHPNRYGRIEDLRIENKLKEFRSRTAHADNDCPLKVKIPLPSNMEPTFFIGGGNGAIMIDEILTGLGWKRTRDKTDENYKMKWCEVKGHINYSAFKEGEQMVNHIPNCNLLTNKMGLLNSLQEYSRLCASTRKRAVNLDFLPETYRLDNLKDREAFMTTYKETEVWICKPTGRNQGKGIFLVRSLDEIKKMLDEQDLKKEEGKPVKPMNRIIQRYIHNPLLLEGKKFDIRCYMLVANTTPFLVLYHKGYVRLCLYEYDNDNENLTVHLTNQFIQKKDENYKDMKEDSVWSMDKFNQYINENLAEEKGLEQDWVYKTLTNKMKSIITTSFNAVKSKLAAKIGYFDLYGLDFMVDENMKIWLIEVNVNPCLATNCEALKEAVPPVVKETIYVAVECFDKSRKNKPLMPLNSLKTFDILYNGSKQQSSKDSAGPSRNQSSSVKSRQNDNASPVRRSKSQSPVKEMDAGSRRSGVGVPKQTPSGVPRQTPAQTPMFNYNSHTRYAASNDRNRNRFQESSASRPIKTQENSASRPIKTQENSASRPIKAQETSASRPIKAQETSASRPIKAQETSASRPIKSQEPPVSRPVRSSVNAPARQSTNRSTGFMPKSNETSGSRNTPLNKTPVGGGPAKKSTNSAESSDEQNKKTSDNDSAKNELSENELKPIKESDESDTSKNKDSDKSSTKSDDKTSDDSETKNTVKMNRTNSEKSDLSNPSSQESEKEPKKRVKSSKVVPPPPTRPVVPKATDEKPNKPVFKGPTEKKSKERVSSKNSSPYGDNGPTPVTLKMTHNHTPKPKKSKSRTDERNDRGS